MVDNEHYGATSVPTGGSIEDDEFINENEHQHHHDGMQSSAHLNEKAQKYIQKLLAERARMEDNFPLAVKLIDEALERVQLNGRIPTREQYADVYQQRTIKLSQKVHVPIKDKKFNYVGKLLGPKGNSLRRLQEETQCKIVILGRFSMKDRVREEELRNSADAKYAHLNLPLHVEVSTIAPPAEAYARVAYALAEIRRYLIPDKHDDIRQEQFRELMEDPESAKKISLRQQQQQLESGSHPGSGAGMDGNYINNRGGGGGGGGGGSGGGYRSNKYQQHQQQQQTQNHPHNTEETVFYRPHNNTHQPKPAFIPGPHRSNMPHPAMPPQAVLGATGMIVSAANVSGRGGGMMPNNAIVGGNAIHGLRFRPPVPYQIIKK